jgi:Tetratricopeptide repeat
MRGVRWAIYLWPGLADLWWRGAWSGLALAAAFALLVNLLIASTLIWGELLGPNPGGTIWGGFVAAWLALLVVSIRTSPAKDEAALGGAGDLFPSALTEYLRGNWVEAELLARKLIARLPADVEATLLLAAVLRHTNRFDEARETLDTLTLWDRAAAWRMEIDVAYGRLSAKQNRLADEAKPGRQAAPGDAVDETEREVQGNEGAADSLPEWRRAA